MSCRLHDLAARLRSQQGNTLLLMPVGVLILLILAAIAVDAAVLFLAQRRVADLAATAASDAVAYLDQEEFYRDGQLELVASRGHDRANLVASRLPQDDALIGPSCGVPALGVRDDGAPTAAVTCTASARLIFATAIPGAERIREVRATDTAVGLQSE